MPLLFSLGQHAALSAVASRLEEGERLFAFLDDLYVLCDPARVLDVYAILQQELSRHAGIQIHQGKTKVWNQGGIVPIGVERLEVEARRIDPDAIVWRGNSDIPTEQQGLKILGCPVGHHDFVQDQLSMLADTHSVLLDGIILLVYLQSAWLLLVFCAAARANFFLRSVTPGETSAFATRHDDQMWSCLFNLLELSPANVPESSRMAGNVAVTVRRFEPQQRGG